MTVADALSSLAPFPAPWPLPADYDRHQPTSRALHEAIGAVGDSRDWARAGWVELCDGLLALGRADVPLSRLGEGHVDALRILAQADAAPVPGARYGVWASRSQQTGLQGRWSGSELIVDGAIRFASGAGVLDRALVPVWTSSTEHVLVDVAVDGLPVDTSQWRTPAMAVSASHTVAVAAVPVDPAAQIGPVDFYLSRPGFFPGGVGVAACWAGGAARVADLTRARLREPKPALAARLGRIRILLATAGALVRGAAVRLDELGATSASAEELRELSTEARAGVAAAVHGVLDEAHRIGGPAGLAFDEDLTRAVHDLRLYVLQQNADADEAYLGVAGSAG